MKARPHIGFTCAYTPVQLIHAAGFTPFRILPMGTAPSQAGMVLHENMCPHVKQVLDRLLAGDVPELAALVLMNSCEAMRRLADAVTASRPDIPVILIDLPSEASQEAAAYYAAQLSELLTQLNCLTQSPADTNSVVASIGKYNHLIDALNKCRKQTPYSASGSPSMQALYNLAVTATPEQTLDQIERRDTPQSGQPKGVPIYLFGNLLCDPAAFEMIERAGCRILGDDLCTGVRQLTYVDLTDSPGLDPDPIGQLAHALLNRAPCGRTVCSDKLPHLANYITEQVTRSGAVGAIAHVMKFCDPYLARLPAVRQQLRQHKIPLLILEADGTLGSFGQQRTRIEAFVETLGGHSQ